MIVEIYAALKKTEICLEDEEKSMQMLASASQMQMHKKGDILANYGQEVEHFFIVASGHVKLYRDNEDGQEVVISTLDNGQGFFYPSLFLGMEAPAHAETLERSEIIQIPVRLMREVVMQNMSMTKLIAERTSSSFVHLYERIEEFTLKSPEQRVCYFLLKEFIKNGSDQLSFPLPYKKSVIASELGMTPETFSRVLARLKKVGVTVKKNIVFLAQSDALCHVCTLETAQNCVHFDPDQCARTGYVKED